ncbi:CGNR zinc finger domain-containing protein [Micromonospora sp. DR5-3]|uniref:CGNR zinc finger domain-containing protein n=1 Tax=unclassified Micromonospora TaxID=2617518 RepID=UPI0011D7F9C4|nr:MULTISPECIES: CGNR zinc finger domain-containing protein [unclassified Micromonospora]MCW3815232.1 CGNR zinc finger domain-containing protein [Micromonospora sp. DR5-3]TYC21336.1 CGNR zinc finger domain-containing protein [Micromonospora sp. MP36]
MSAVPPLEPALRLAVALLHSYWVLQDPVDQLSVARLRAAGREFGLTEVTDPIGDAELPRLRELRARLYEVFAAPDPAARVATLNDVLAEVSAGTVVEATSDGGLRLTPLPRPGPIGPFAATVTGALARAAATGGAERFGVCAADPCRAPYLDRTRAGRQRYCCELCNNRAAAAAYRSRTRRG